MTRSISRRDVMRLVALIDGSLDQRASSRMRARIEREPDLARAHARLLQTRELLRQQHEAPAPDLPYRQIEAQVRWRLAHEDENSRAAGAPRGARVSLKPLVALTAAAVAGAAFSLGGYRLVRMIGETEDLVDRPPRASSRSAEAAPGHAHELAALTTLAAGEVNVALAGGDIVALDMNRPVLVGERVITGANAMATLQWAPDTGVEIEAQSEVEISRLDTERQILALWQGRMKAHVKPEEGERSLAVVAGPVRVQVTGTQFAVALTGGVAEVEVYEGAVHVKPAREGVPLPPEGLRIEAGSRLRVERDASTPTKLLGRAKGDARLHLQPWPNLHRVLAVTGLLAVETEPPGATLRLDAVEVGETNLRLRGSAGRHLVEIWRDGKLLRREWVMFVPSASERLALDVRPPAPPTKLASLPNGIYETFRWRARQIRTCYERRLKSAPALSGKLVLRVSVGKSGHVEDASLDKDTLGDASVGACALAAVKGWRFPAGNPIEVVYPFTFHPAR